MCAWFHDARHGDFEVADDEWAINGYGDYAEPEPPVPVIVFRPVEVYGYNPADDDSPGVDYSSPFASEVPGFEPYVSDCCYVPGFVDDDPIPF
jgi:hypothetical protein